MESSRLADFECEISPGYDVRQESYGFQQFRHEGSGLRPPTKRCELPLIFAAIGQAIRHRKVLNLGSLNMQFQQDWPRDKKYSSLIFLQENLEKFRSTELYYAPPEGSTIFFIAAP